MIDWNKAKLAIRNRVLAVWPSIPGQWDGQSFTPPDDKALFFIEQLMPVAERCVATNMVEGIAIIQYEVSTDASNALFDAEALALKVADEFKPGSDFTYSGTSVTVDRCERSQTYKVEDKWWRLPIRIRIRTYVVNTPG